MASIDTSSKNYSEQALENFKAIFSFDDFFSEVTFDLKKKMTENELKELHDLFEKVFFKNFAKHATEIAKKRMHHERYSITNINDIRSIAVISGDTAKGSLKVSFYVQQGLDEEWKVFDLAIDDVLLSRNYRGSFNRIYREQGFTEIINRLEKRNLELGKE
jgi:ABC-type transporter MlaC component